MGVAPPTLASMHVRLHGALEHSPSDLRCGRGAGVHRATAHRHIQCAGHLMLGAFVLMAVHMTQCMSDKSAEPARHARSSHTTLRVGSQRGVSAQAPVGRN